MIDFLLKRELGCFSFEINVNRLPLSMSIRPRTQAGFIQGNQSPKGQDVSQSALYYLFKEVSKLASPVHNSFMETDSMWISSEEDAQSFHCSSTNQRSPHTSLNPQVKNVQESPLKVLSLINLQCQRLLHQSEDNEPDPSSRLLFSNVGNSSVSSNPPPTKAGHQVNHDIASFQESAQSLTSESQSVRTSHSHLEKDCSTEDTGHKSEFSVKSSSDVCPVKAEVNENIETVKPEQSEDNAEAPQTSEIKFNVGLDWSGLCLSTQHTFYDFFPETHPAKEPCSHEHKCVTESLLTLDHNANICLNTNSLCDELHNCPFESVEPQCNTSEPSSLQQTEVQVTASTCEHSSEEISRPKPLGLTEKHSHTLSVELTSEQNEDSVKCTDRCSTWRAKRRKQSCPSRSASVQDPDFQGVTFRMDTELDDTKEQCRLLITSKYSKELPKSVKKPRLKTRRSLNTSSDEESDTATIGAKGKVCASCCTRKTPMWRDAEDGTPLCNACGIRYKKYRVRCINCWHIPKKEGNSSSRCIKCGNFVRLTTAQRRATS